MGIADRRKGSAAVSVRDLERAFGRPPRAALCVHDRVTVVAAGRRHETEPKQAAIVGIAEAGDGPAPFAVRRLEVPVEDRRQTGSLRAAMKHGL